jgi:histidine triad (HIT) family protein
MPLDLPHQERCSFCAYLDGERPYAIAERSDLTAILVTREQRGVAHVLAIPASHRLSVLDLADDEAAAVMDAVRRSAAAIAAAYDPSGIAVWQNNGRPAFQTIPHVHFHVAGTLPQGGTDWGDVPAISMEEAQAIADRLRPHL